MCCHRVLGALSLCLALACRQKAELGGGASAPDVGKEPPARSVPASTPEAPPQVAGPIKVDLLAKELEPKNEDNPRVTLLLLLNEPGKPEQSIELLTVGGSCARQVDKEAEPGAIVTQRCWFAGSGDTLSVYRDGDALVVRHQESDEAVEAPLPVKDLKRVPLPPGALVTTL